MAAVMTHPSSSLLASSSATAAAAAAMHEEKDPATAPAPSPAPTPVPPPLPATRTLTPPPPPPRPSPTNTVAASAAAGAAVSNSSAPPLPANASFSGSYPPAASERHVSVRKFTYDGHVVKPSAGEKHPQAMGLARLPTMMKFSTSSTNTDVMIRPRLSSVAGVTRPRFSTAAHGGYSPHAQLHTGEYNPNSPERGWHGSPSSSSAVHRNTVLSGVPIQPLRRTTLGNMEDANKTHNAPSAAAAAPAANFADSTNSTPSSSVASSAANSAANSVNSSPLIPATHKLASPIPPSSRATASASASPSPSPAPPSTASASSLSSALPPSSVCSSVSGPVSGAAAAAAAKDGAPQVSVLQFDIDAIPEDVKAALLARVTRRSVVEYEIDEKEIDVTDEANLKSAVKAYEQQRRHSVTQSTTFSQTVATTTTETLSNASSPTFNHEPESATTPQHTSPLILTKQKFSIDSTASSTSSAASSVTSSPIMHQQSIRLSESIGAGAVPPIRPPGIDSQRPSLDTTKMGEIIASIDAQKLAEENEKKSDGHGKDAARGSTSLNSSIESYMMAQQKQKQFMMHMHAMKKEQTIFEGDELASKKSDLDDRDDEEHDKFCASDATMSGAVDDHRRSEVVDGKKRPSKKAVKFSAVQSVNVTQTKIVIHQPKSPRDSTHTPKGILKHKVRRETLEEALQRIWLEREGEKKYLDFMSQGSILIKYSTHAKPYPRVFFVTPDGGELVWDKPTKEQMNQHSNHSPFSTPKLPSKKSGWPQFRILNWKINAQRSRSIGDVLGVYYGPFVSENFTRYLDMLDHAAGKPWLCMTVEFADRTLDVVCENEEQVTKWFLGIQALAPLTVHYLPRGALLWQRLIMKMNFYGLDVCTTGKCAEREAEIRQRILGK